MSKKLQKSNSFYSVITFFFNIEGDYFYKNSYGLLIVILNEKENYQRLCVDEIDYDNNKIIKLCRKYVKSTESEDKTEIIC